MAYLKPSGRLLLGALALASSLITIYSSEPVRTFLADLLGEFMDLVTDIRIVVLIALNVIALALIARYILHELRRFVQDEVIIHQSELMDRDQSLAASTELLGVHYSFFANLPHLWNDTDREHSLKSLVEVLLLECQKLLGPTITRVYVLLPDEDDKFLWPFVLQGIPTAHDYERKFYIGGDDPSRRRGLAGAAYVNDSVEKAHFVDEANPYPLASGFDHDEFIVLGEPDRPLQYRAVVAVPIRDPITNRAIGIICLDSAQPNAFREEILDASLLNLGALVALAISYSRDLGNILDQGLIDLTGTQE